MLGFRPYETFQLLIESGSDSRRNTLLAASCDAFVRRGRPTPSELEQFEALAARLFPAAEASVRMRAAVTLGKAAALSPTLEALVIENIGDGLPEFLATAPQLSDAALTAVLDGNDVRCAAAIAKRADLSDPVLSRLFHLNSRNVYRALAANSSITPRGTYLSALARSAQMDHEVAATLASRPDFDCALLAPAFFDLEETARLEVISAFAKRPTPAAPIKRTLEQLSVVTDELTRALMKLFSENRRPEVTRLLHQITGLDEVRCGQIAHDVSGAALFVVLRAFGCTSHDGLKVIIHAASHDSDRSAQLGHFAQLFDTVSVDAMTFLLNSWRGDVNLLELNKPEFRPFTEPSTRTPAIDSTASPVVEKAIDALTRIGARRRGLPR